MPARQLQLGPSPERAQAIVFKGKASSTAAVSHWASLARHKAVHMCHGPLPWNLGQVAHAVGVFLGDPWIRKRFGLGRHIQAEGAANPTL